jgi:protein gp37
MGLNKQKGNMYPWVTHTWNAIKGRCPHGCSYCYMNVYPNLPELHLDQKELKVDLGEGNFIFVGSSCDMWAEAVPSDWIELVLEKCQEHNNRYLFQSKNPSRFQYYLMVCPLHSVFGTTIESNRSEDGLAPLPYFRYKAMRELPGHKMVSIEPIMDFDLYTMIKWIGEIGPDFVSIGADSKGHNLPEPSPDKVNVLIEELSNFTEVKVKDNLKRIRQEVPVGNEI